MLDWLKHHQHNPYPNEIEKEALMAQTGLSISQINYWFTNARRRILPKWMLQKYLEEQAIATGEDPSKIKVTGSANEVRQIAKDMLQGRALPYLGRPTQSPSPPINVRSPVWPSSEEVRNYSAPSPNMNYYNNMNNNNRVFSNYNPIPQNHHHQNPPEGDLISFANDTYSNNSETKPSIDNLASDLKNANSYVHQLQRQRSDASSISIKEESCDGSESGDHLKTNITDLSFLLS